MQKLAELSYNFRRPDDFFAEMIKTDQHMQKIQRKLLADKEDIEAAEQRRRVRDGKKFGKQVQVKREEEKTKERKSNMAAARHMQSARKAKNSLVDDREGDYDGPPRNSRNDRKRPAEREASNGFGCCVCCLITSVC